MPRIAEIVLDGQGGQREFVGPKATHFTVRAKIDARDLGKDAIKFDFQLERKDGRNWRPVMGMVWPPRNYQKERGLPGANPGFCIMNWPFAGHDLRLTWTDRNVRGVIYIDDLEEPPTDWAALT